MFRSKKGYGTPIAVFDISSSSVGGAHALVGGDTKHLPTILASSRVDAPLQEDLNMQRFVSDTVKNLESVILEIKKADHHVPEHIELVLASPWFVSQTRSIVRRQAQAFVCTKNFLQEVVNEEIARLIATELSRFGEFGKEGMVVEKQISQIKLNGYPTADPFGKKALSIEVFLTVTVVPKQIVDLFTGAIHRAYGSRAIAITTSPYATFVVARDFFDAAHECVIIDVGEEVTDVAFVKEGLFLYQHSFPVGTYGFYRSLMEKTKHTPAEARAVVEGYRLSKVSTTARSKIDKALVAFSSQWQKAFQSILDEGQFGFCLPETCYITADTRFEGVFPGIIATDPFIQHTCSRGKVVPHFLSDERFSKFITSLDQEIDVPLATAVLYVARII